MIDYTIELENIIASTKGQEVSNFFIMARSQSNHAVILYGAGTAAGIALTCCRIHGIEVTAICDKKAVGRYERSNASLPIISPTDLFEHYKDAFVLITSWNFENEILSYLSDSGFPRDNIFTFRIPARLSPEIFIEQFMTGYKRAFDYFDDDASKRLIIDTARSYLTSDIISSNTNRPMYYEWCVRLGDHEVFLDGGAGDGDTINGFIKHTGGRYSYIYAFEPDEELCSKAREKSSGLRDTELFAIGLSDTVGEQAFYCGGLVAPGFDERKYYLSEKPLIAEKTAGFRTEMRKTTTIDDICCNRQLPTFIKLNVSGSEKKALIGATTVIRESKPILAVAACYDIEAVYTIPEVISKIRGDYRFCLLQHGYGYYERILYAY